MLNLFWKENVKICASALVLILKCDMKDTICTCAVKHEIERVEEFLIKEMWENFNVYA